MLPTGKVNKDFRTLHGAMAAPSFVGVLGAIPVEQWIGNSIAISLTDQVRFNGADIEFGVRPMDVVPTEHDQYNPRDTNTTWDSIEDFSDVFDKWMYSSEGGDAFNNNVHGRMLHKMGGELVLVLCGMNPSPELLKALIDHKIVLSFMDGETQTKLFSSYGSFIYQLTKCENDEYGASFDVPLHEGLDS